MNLGKSIAALGVAVAVGLPAQQAFALLPADFDTSTIVVNQTGASAQRDTLNRLAVATCAAGTLTEYRDVNPTTGAVGARWRSFFCELGATWPDGSVNTLAGSKALFNIRTKGGSVWGVIPIQENYTIEMMDVTGPNCVPSGARIHCTVAETGLAGRSPGVDVATNECGINAAVDGAATGRPTGANDSICVKGDLGASDEEGAFFTDENLPSIFTAGPDASKLNAASMFAVQFGIQVTKPVYRVLQETQGLLAIGAPDDFGNDATRPSMTKEQLASIFSGTTTSWTGIATPLAGGATWPDFGFGSMGICRRVDGSGTQAGVGRHFLSRPSACGGSITVVAETDPLDGTDDNVCSDGSNGLYCVIENESSGDVNVCMDRMNGVGPAINLFVGPQGAIGFNGIEKQPGGANGTEWDFVKIDGVAPTTANGVSGEYDYQFENSIQTSTSFPYALTAPNTATIVAALKQQLPQPAVIAALGLEGVFATRANGFAPSTTAPLVSFGSRLGNSCNELIVVP